MPVFASWPPAGFVHDFFGPAQMIPRQRLYFVCGKRASRNQILSLFSKFPGMEYCDIKTERTTGESKGFGYVNYSTPHAALQAQEQLNGIILPTGYRLKVVFAEPLGVRKVSSDVPPMYASDPVTMTPEPTFESQNSADDSRLYISVAQPISISDAREAFNKISGLEYVRFHRDTCGYAKVLMRSPDLF